MIWNCPLCQQPLTPANNGLRCASQHHFDRAKEGYINLLPVQHKRSKQPGDSAEMMQARRDFLDAGFYQPLQQAVTTLLSNNLPQQKLTILDIGCGEGYYTAAIAKRFADREQREVIGLDVAKVAIRAAAKRYADVAFCVASSHRLPFADASLDAVVRIYAPCKASELTRVLKPGGIMLTVTPGPRHLIQFKSLIYSEVQLHAAEAELLPGMTLQQESQLAYAMRLDGKSATTLLQMTPFAWRAKPAVWEYLAEQGEFSCETDFMLRLWRRD